jgi:hypothetical protein
MCVAAFSRLSGGGGYEMMTQLDERKQNDPSGVLRMKKSWIMAGLACAAGLWTAGCDWEGSSSEQSISDRYNWVNFSGVYRAASGGILITDYTIVGTEETGGVTNRVTNEAIGTAEAMQTVFSGSFRNGNIVPGSVQVVVGGFVLADGGASGDDGAGSGELSGSGKTGTISYASGAWSVDLEGDVVPAGTTLRGRYSYTRSSTPGTGGAGSGVSGRPILTLAASQNGNSLSLLDNNGATYSGKISSIRSTGGVSQNIPGTATNPADGDTVTANFEVSGRSAAGVSVRLVGTFSGLVELVQQQSTGGMQTSQPAQVRVLNRQVSGTWIEPGRTGDVNGVSGPQETTTVGPTL